jgi:hypothetical protein
MPLDKRINYESIDALKTILIKSINNGEKDRVLNNLKTFDESIQKLFALSNDRFEEILLNKENKESGNLYWNEEENYSSSFNSILVFYSECTKVAIESNKINIANEFKNSFNRILRRYLLKKRNIVLLKMFFKKQEELFKYCIDTDNGLSHSFGYHWYYDLTFDSSNTYGLFDLNYLELFDKQLFKYIQYAIQRRNKKWLRGWIDWLHHGIGFMELNRFSSYTYFKNVDLKEIDIKAFHEIDDKFKNINSLEKYNDFKKEFILLNEKLKNRDSINVDENEKKQNEVIKKALTNYLFHNAKHLLFSSFAYSLYKNFYDLLYEMLNTNNSSKSDVIMVGHKVLPQNMNDIISMWIKESVTIDDENRKFKFGNVFSENDYYEAMLTFILIIHLKIDKDNISFNNEKYFISELMFLKEKVNYLKEKINDIEIYKDELKQQNKKFNLEITKQNILEILNKIFSDIENKIDKKIDDSKISEDRVKELKDGFYNEYENSSDNIRNTLSLIDGNIFKQEKYIEDSKKFGLKNKLPRRFFVEETNTCVEYLGRQYAENFIRAINTEILKLVLDKSKNIFINQLDEIIKKIGQNDVIIFSTGYSDILNNNKKFKHSWEIKNENYSITPSAYYEYEENDIPIPIFSFFTNFDDSKTFILNKKKFFAWIEYELSLEKQNIKDNIYFSIDEINEDKENVILNLYTTFEIEFEKDFECFFIDG